MNILLINHYAGSPSHGMEYRPYYLAKEWAQQGHSVTIVAASNSHIRTKEPTLNGAQIIYENINGVNYQWYKTPSYTGNGIGRVRNILAFIRKISADKYRLAKTIKPDVVIASSTYPMDIRPAYKIAKISNAQLIYEVHDLWPLSPMELGKMSRFHPFIIWCQKAEDFAYKHSNKIVSMLPKTLKHMKSRGMSSDKFNYIPNGIALEDWETIEELPKDIYHKIRKIKEQGLPIVGYAGTHGLANALDVLLDAAKDAQNDFQVILIGPGPDRSKLLKRLKDEKISNVTMLPAIPKMSIPAFLKEIDIAYIGWHNNPLYRFGISPNKLMDYMMAAKPIIHSVNAGNDPVAEAKCGITIHPLDPNATINAVKLLTNMSEKERKEMGENGKKFILENHTYRVLAGHFIKVIEA